MTLDQGDHIQYQLALDVKPAVEALEEFAKVGNKSVKEMETDIVALQKQITSLGNAIERVNSKKGQESAFVFINGKKELKSAEDLKKQYNDLKEKAISYTQALTKLKNQQAEVEDTIRRVNTANKLFEQGLDKQPTKIKQVQSAYDQLFKQIEKLEKLPVKTEDQTKFLAQLHAARKLESNDLQQLITLEAKYGAQIKATEDARKRAAAEEIQRTRREQAYQTINSRLGIKAPTGEISRQNRQQALNAAFSVLPTTADIEAQQRNAVISAQRQAEIRQRVLANIAASQLGRESSNFGKADIQAKESVKQLKELTATYKAARQEVVTLIKSASSKEDLQAIRLKTEAMFAYSAQVDKAIAKVVSLNGVTKDVISSRTAIQTPLFSPLRQQSVKPKLAAIPLPPDTLAQQKAIEAQLKSLTAEYLRAGKAAIGLKNANKGFATPEVAQATAIQDKYRKSLESTIAVAKKLGLETVSVARANEALSRTFGSTVNPVFKLFQGVSQLGFAFFGLQAALYAVTIPLGAIKTAFVDTNATLETAKISFAGTFNNVYVEDFSKSMERAADIVGKIRAEAARTNLTFQELQEVMGTSLPQVLGRGGNADQALEIASRLAQQAKVNLGKQFAPSRVNDELRALLTGNITTKNETLISLGITKEDVKNAKDMEGILKLLENRTQGLAAANQAYQQAFDGATDRASEFIFSISTFLGKPIFDAAKDSLNALNREFATFVDKSGNVDESKISGFLLTVRGINNALAITIQKLGELLAKLKPLSDFFSNTGIGRILGTAGVFSATGAAIGSRFGSQGALTGAAIGGGVGTVVGTVAEAGNALEGDRVRGRFDQTKVITRTVNGKPVTFNGPQNFLRSEIKPEELNALEKTTIERVKKLQFQKSRIDQGRVALNPAQLAVFNAKYKRENDVLFQIQQAKKARTGVGTQPGELRNPGLGLGSDKKPKEPPRPSTLGLKGLNDVGEVQKVINKYDLLVQELDSGAGIKQAIVDSINPGSLKVISLDLDNIAKKMRLLSEARSDVFNATARAREQEKKLEAEFNKTAAADQKDPGNEARVQALSVLKDEYTRYRAEREKGEKEQISLTKEINALEIDQIKTTRKLFDEKLQRNLLLINSENEYTQAIANNGSASDAIAAKTIAQEKLIQAEIDQTIKEIESLNELKTSVSVNGIVTNEEQAMIDEYNQRLDITNNKLKTLIEAKKDNRVAGLLEGINANLGQEKLNIETARLSFGSNTPTSAAFAEIEANKRAIAQYDKTIS